MFSILILFVMLVALALWAQRSAKKIARIFACIVLLLLVSESTIYAFFLTQIYKGNALFLIGHQRLLDLAGKVRLIYSVYYAQGQKTFVYRIDPDLGYTVASDKDSGSIRTNRSGMRSDRDYALIPKSDVLRMAVFGSSFVFCDGVSNEETWPYYLEHSVGQLDVLNFGVSGYGFAQSYLRFFKDGLPFAPDIVFFNVILYGDREGIRLDRMARTNLRSADFYRARFWIDDGNLMSESLSPFHLFDPSFRETYIYNQLNVNNKSLFERLGILTNTNMGLFVRNVMWNKQALATKSNIDENALELNVMILNQLAQNVERMGSRIIFFAPYAIEELPLEIRSLLEQHSERFFYFNSKQMLEAAIQKRGFVYEKLLNESNHFNPTGNRIYADVVLDILKKRSWPRGNGHFSYNGQTNSFVNYVGAANTLSKVNAQAYVN